MNRRITDAIAVIATALWTSSIILNAVNPKYQPHPSINVVMTIVAGAAFGNSFRKRKEERADSD